MLSFRSFATLALLLSPIFGLPTRVAVTKVIGDKLQDSYIVKLKNGANKQATLSWLKSQFGAAAVISHDYDPSFLNAFAAKLPAAAIEALGANTDVEYITEDAIFHTQAAMTQKNAPWGLQRINGTAGLKGSDPSKLEYQYTYDENAGDGVDVYVVDTGIYTMHNEFQGRARWGWSYLTKDVLPMGVDGNGHGTHCAGTIGSRAYGVAKKASLIAVQVMNPAGSGLISDIVAGLDWVVKESRASGRPSVVSMSLGGGANEMMDDATKRTIDAGIHVVVAAGNSGDDASNYSPARVERAITVGASTINDTRASFSCIGSAVDIFAPGQDVISTWIGLPDATKQISGTSMATPHVAGVVAYWLSRYPDLSPLALAEKIEQHAVKGMLSGISGDTPNLLLQRPPL
ncbi:subtilisin-like serine protease [Tulasnella sp. 419]|nr:subtilisin-like serine protease [Tulasnella sp. 419]